MLMFNALPYFVFLGNKKFKINVDFRNMILFENKILDKNVSNQEKIRFGLANFYPENVQLILSNLGLYKEACDKLVWFYRCGNREDYHKKAGNTVNASQIYSYEYDDEYIYGAFLNEYGIDLAYDKVHWWKFKALLKSLSNNAEFVKIKGYRAYSGKDENMLELKKYWELPLFSDEQQRLDALYESLK